MVYIIERFPSKVVKRIFQLPIKLQNIFWRYWIYWVHYFKVKSWNIMFIFLSQEKILNKNYIHWNMSEWTDLSGCNIGSLPCIRHWPTHGTHKDFCIAEKNCFHLLEIHHLVSSLENMWQWGTWVAQSVKRLPSAQVMIPESQDRVPQGACFSPSLSCSLFQINKQNLKKK